MFDYKEIEWATKDNHLPFQKIEGADKEILTQKLHDISVLGNPRTLWLGLKYMPYSIDCNMEDPCSHLSDTIDKDTAPYFSIDYWNKDFVIYKAKMSDVHKFISDCEGLGEYYLVTENFMELYSIIGHDDLPHIDVRKSEMKKLITNE